MTSFLSKQVTILIPLGLGPNSIKLPGFGDFFLVFFFFLYIQEINGTTYDNISEIVNLNTIQMQI